MRLFKLPEGARDVKPLMTTLFMGLVVVIMGLTTMSGSRDVAGLEDRHAELSSELAKTDRTILEQQAARDGEKTEAVVKATGLDPALIAADTTVAESYFAPAFSWTSGKTYDDARIRYEETLGKDNSFTKTYFPENIKIDTNNGDLSFIDFKQLKTTMDDLVIVPTAGQDSRIRYVAFVSYFMHKDAADLADTSALVPSTAIIEFTASGESTNRMISEVEAWSGFTATLE